MSKINVVFIALFITFVNCETAEPAIDGSAKSEFSWPTTASTGSTGGNSGLPINFDDITPTMLEQLVRIITANIETIESSNMMRGFMDAVDAVGGLDRMDNMANIAELVQKFSELQGKDSNNENTESSQNKTE